VQTAFAAGDGRTLSYSRRGEGPLVVCVPGGPGMDPEAYFAALELPGRELLIFAPRGVGDSSRPQPPDAYRLADYVSDLEALRRHLGEDRLTLYGNSHGGCVVLAYACRHPEAVQRAVIANGPPNINEGMVDATAEVRRRFSEAFEDGAQRLRISEETWPVIEATPDGPDRVRLLRSFMSEYVARTGSAETAYLDRLCSAPMNFDPVTAMYAEFSEGLDLMLEAAEATSPTLVIGCEFDVVVPAAGMRELAGAMRDATYAEIAGSGHFPEVEQPAELTAVVTRFLADSAR
jgi:pimeloyl-ACP methyl ester carboxylesterase